MEQNAFPTWLPWWVAIAWLPFVIALSVIFRRSRGKPIVPKVAGDALYVEKWASGSFASNCLLVSVTNQALSVVPKFPFNLGFLPEIYRLEYEIPTAAIREVRRIGRFGLGNNVAVVYGNDGREKRLRVRNPQAFIDVLAGRSRNIRVSR